MDEFLRATVLSVLSFFVLFVLRRTIAKNIWIAIVSHSVFLLLTIVVSIGGGGAISDSYVRLDQFIELEKNQKLDEARKSLKKHDSMLEIDLQQFKNSSEFRAYIEETYNDVETLQSVSFGWFFVLISDIALACIFIVHHITHTVRKRFTKKS